VGEHARGLQVQATRKAEWALTHHCRKVAGHGGL
jgi:hypothetical protein